VGLKKILAQTGPSDMDTWDWSSPPKRERRVAERRPSSRVTSCSMIRLPHAVPVNVQLRDISTSGIGLDSPVWVEPGSFLLITLAGAGNFSRTLKVQVIHVTLKNQKWILGCALATHLTAEEWRVLI
jgi:hypothetical protein